MLVLPVAEDFDELLQDGCLTAIAALGEFGRVVVVAIYTALVLVVAVRRAEYGGTYGAGEVLDVVLAFQRSDVRAAEGLPACVAQQVKPAKVVGLTQWILARGLFGDGEELGSYDFAAVLTIVSEALVGRL